MAETKAGRIRKEFDSTGDVWPSDIEWLIDQAERAEELEKDNVRLKDDRIGAQEVVKKSVELLDNHEAENARLQELVKTLKLHAVHCDSDGRAIQPYEIIDVINEFTAGETNGQRQA